MFYRIVVLAVLIITPSIKSVFMFLLLFIKMHQVYCVFFED